MKGTGLGDALHVPAVEREVVGVQRKGDSDAFAGLEPDFLKALEFSYGARHARCQVAYIELDDFFRFFAACIYEICTD